MQSDPGIAAADHDHVFAGGQKVFLRGQFIAGDALVLLRQKFHREVNALKLAARHRKNPRDFSEPPDNNTGVEFGQQAVHRHVHAHIARWF